MIFHQASVGSISAFLVLYAIVVGLALKSVFKIEGHQKWILTYIIVTFIISIGAYLEITLAYLIPMVPLIFVLILAFCLSFSYSETGKKLSDKFSFAALLGFQSFRFPLELILHEWGRTKTIPITMTFGGQNFDITAGLLCLVLIPFYSKSKKLVWSVQLISFLLLLNVMRVVMMSLPLPFSWDLEIPLQVIFHMPYALIVPGFVAIAIIGHLLVFRKLLEK